MKRLVLFAQDKGGIGKSFVATLLHDWYRDIPVSVKAFDLDHANATFERFVPEAEFLHTDVAGGQLGVLDRVVQALEEAEVVLVDNRASGGRKVLAYLEEVRLVELQEELGFQIVFVVIATEDKDGNSQIADLLDAYAERVRWVVVRNLREGGELAAWAQSKARQRLLGLGAVEVEVPCLADVTRNRLQALNLTVGAGRTDGRLHLLDRSRCVRYYGFMREEFGKAKEVLL